MKMEVIIMTNQQNMELRSYIGSCNSEKDDLKRVIDLSVQWGLTAHEICLFLISVGVNAEVVERATKTHM